jgi:hypothetical protein
VSAQDIVEHKLSTLSAPAAVPSTVISVQQPALTAGEHAEIA